jgi:hypothetical protein
MAASPSTIEYLLVPTYISSIIEYLQTIDGLDRPFEKLHALSKNLLLTATIAAK